MNPDFERCRIEAVRLLLTQDTLCPVNVASLHFSKHIIIDSLQHFSHLTQSQIYRFTNQDALLKNGCTVILNSTYLILYNVKESNQARLNWTLAHEVGHVYLGHKKDGQLEEIEANFFASELLMPEILIRSLPNQAEMISPKFLSEMFHVSRSAASKKIQTIRRKPEFIPTIEDRELLFRHRMFLYQASMRHQEKAISKKFLQNQQKNSSNLIALESNWLQENH